MRSNLLPPRPLPWAARLGLVLLGVAMLGFSGFLWYTIIRLVCR